MNNFQAKRLEQALVTKHNLFSEERQQNQAPSAGHGLPRHRSLRGRNSLRLTGDSAVKEKKRKVQKSHGVDHRIWSSIETLDTSQVCNYLDLLMVAMLICTSINHFLREFY